MTLAVLTEEQLAAVVERALEPLRQEIAGLRRATEAEGVTVEEAGRRLGLSSRSIRRRLRDGSLSSVRVGGARRVLLSGLLTGEVGITRLADRGREE